MSPQRVAALRAMAYADESPQERDIARTKLAEAGVPIDPPPPVRRMPPPPPFGWSGGLNGAFTSSTATTTSSFGGTIWMRVAVR